MIEPKINEGRDAPAYQEYAASMMGRIEYRTLSLSHRGLLYTLRLECWVNQRMPIDPIKLAKVLGLDGAEVSKLLPELSPFFEVVGEWIYLPDLECYRVKVQDRRNRQSQGGKEGRRRYKEKLTSSSIPDDQVASNSSLSNFKVLSKDKINSNKSKAAYRKENSNPPEDPDIDAPF